MVDFVDMAALKDDVGITGTADDAWLARRVANALEAFGVYTSAYIGPVQAFEDDWSRVVYRGRYHLAPHVPIDIRVAPYFVHAPVTEVTAAFQGTTSLDVAKVLFNPETGEIQSLSGSPVVDVRRDLVGTLTRIQYSAGYETLPGDLYEALVGVIRGPLAVRRGAGAGGLSVGGVAAKSIAIADVGTLTLGGAASEFEAAAMRGAGAVDPLLGPWTASLAPYRDLAGLIGDRGRPVTKVMP